MSHIGDNIVSFLKNAAVKIEELQVDPLGKLTTMLPLRSSNLLDELKDFKSKFSF